MIEDLREGPTKDRVAADICIVGAGAAGLMLAVTLARRGASVVVLESGGSQIDVETQDFNRGEIVGHPHHGTEEGRARAIGGTTTLWGGQLVPLRPIDFEKRPGIDHSGWPIGRADLTPYYEDVLREVGLGRSEWRDEIVWQRIGAEPPALGSQLEPYLSRWCPEPNFARHFGRDLQTLWSLRIIAHATVIQIETQEHQVVELVAADLRGHRVRVTANVFVLCVGTIETVRVLLQTGHTAPWAGLDTIGRYFQDHPVVAIGTVVPRDRSRLHDWFDNIYLSGFKYQPRFHIRTEVQNREHLPGAGGLLMFHSHRLSDLNQLRIAGRALLARRPVSAIRNFTASPGAVDAGIRLAWRTLGRHRSYNPDDLGITLQAQLEQIPRSESRITLSDQRDRMGLRRARVDWRVGERELETAAVFAELCREGFRESGVADVVLDSAIERRDPSAFSRFSDQLHHMGTARMSTSPDTGVVDPDLRVFNTQNLYLCSGAVFPTSGYANPTHTILALALRLADRLSGQNACG